MVNSSDKRASVPPERAEVLVPTGLAARRLALSPERIRELCDQGRLAHVRDASGRRLIPEAEIERMHRDREARHA